MKVLFVCRGNVGRSQMAEALFRKQFPDIYVESAGTKVVSKEGESRHGQVLKDLKFGGMPVIEAMNEIGIDVSEKIRIQLNEGMLAGFDRIIVMAEKENIPQYLSNHANFIFWDVEDPKDHDLDFHIKIRNQIDNLIKENASLFKN